MNCWVCIAGRYRTTSILGRFHAVFFNCHQSKAVTYMLDEIVLVRMMTALDLEFEKAMHYHDEGYESDTDCGFQPQVTRPIDIYSVFTTEASFDLAELTTSQCPISPFNPRSPSSLPFWEGVCQHLTFEEMLPPTEENSEDEEDLPTVDIGYPVWSEEPYQTARSICVYMKYLDQQPYPTSHPTTHTSNPTIAGWSRSTSQPTPATWPSRNASTVNWWIPEDIPDLLGVPEEVMSEF